MIDRRTKFKIVLMASCCLGAVAGIVMANNLLTLISVPAAALFGFVLLPSRAKSGDKDNIGWFGTENIGQYDGGDVGGGSGDGD